MIQRTAGLAAIVLVGGIVQADPGVASNDTLMRQIETLQRQVDRLQAANEAEWLTEQRAEEIRGLVHDVLADADTRASLLQSGTTSGYDGGFFIGSGDGTFSLKVNGQLQLRYVYNQQDLSPTDDNRSGFEMRRTKLKFKGNAFGDWGYVINGAFDRSGGAFELEDFVISYDLGNGWKARGGQFKAPFMREELVSSSRQMLVDRSLVNEEFNQDRSQGIELSWSGDQMRYAVMYSDGLRSSNSPWSDEDTEWGGLTARAEFLASGDWSAFKGMNAFPGTEQSMMIGAAIHYEVEEYGTVSANEVQDLRFTADASLAFDGATIFAAFVYQTLDDDAMLDADRYGFVIQGGMFVSDDTELFARYEYGDYDSAGVEELSAITVGVSRYWNKHGLKWTTDLGFGVDEVDPVWASSGVGWRADAPSEDGQLVLRSQVQLTF
ncbi:MAG: OprO/OprP family phosphate-selective porin [Phycisphaerae bacterium]|nr:OprO/OprP family phosphate-selective porin [Phycisphaerae bacterium]